MSRDPNAPPPYPHGYERTYKPRRDSMAAAEARRWKRDGEAERVEREAAGDLAVEPASGESETS